MPARLCNPAAGILFSTLIQAHPMLTFAADIADLFTDTVGVAYRSGSDAHGAGVFPEEHPERARVSYKTRWVYRPVGDSPKAEISQCSVQFPGHVPLTLDDRIRLPDDTTPPILAIEHVPDERGQRYTKVWC